MKRQKWKEINWAILFGVTLLCTSTQLLCLSPHKRTRNTKLTYVFVIFFLSTFYHISLLRASMHFSVCSCSCYFCIECANYTWQDEKKNKKMKKKSWHDEFGFCTTRRDNSVGRTKSWNPIYCNFSTWANVRHPLQKTFEMKWEEHTLERERKNW